MKTAMVWGADGGIGRALVSKLKEENWTILAMVHQQSELEELTPYTFEADVADATAVERAVKAAGQAADAIDLWIYAAGDISAEKVGEASPDTWRRILDANLVGAYQAAHYSLPLLASDAHLVFLGAVSERMRLPRLSAYAAAKAGLEAFGAVLGKEERKRRVMVVRPAAVDTSLWEKVPFKLPKNAMPPEEAAEQILAAVREGHRGVLDL